MIDLHMHIVPGLDDGPSAIADAVAMGRIAAEDGTTVIIATPHMLDGSYNAQRGQILDGVCALQEAFDNENLALRLLPGADVHATVDLPERVRSDEVLTMADRGKYLMVELSCDVMPQGIEKMFFSLQLTGITPIISHPERNTEVQARSSALFPFVHAGNLIQVTAASLTGHFGRAAERCARELLARDMVHLVASDAHDAEQRPPGLARARSVVERAMGPQKACDIFERNPQSILDSASLQISDPLTQHASRTRRRWGWRRT